MRVFFVIVSLSVSTSLWSRSACSLNQKSMIPDHLQIDFDSIYPDKLAKARSLLKSKPSEQLRYQGVVFSSAQDYARYTAKIEADLIVSKSRFGELEDVIRDSWQKMGYRSRKIKAMLNKLRTKVQNREAIWIDGNFHYIENSGDTLGASLAPDDLSYALAKAQESIATAIASRGDASAQKVVDDIMSLKSVWKQLAKHASVQGWRLRGDSIIELKRIDTSTELGRKLSVITGYSLGKQVVLSYSEDRSQVVAHLLSGAKKGYKRELVGVVKSFSGTEFYNALFR